MPEFLAAPGALQATATLAASLVALVMSVLAYRLTKALRRSVLLNELTLQANLINSSLVNYGVPGPYAWHAQTTREKLDDLQKKGVLVFHHINLLRMVYANRDLLDPSCVHGYQRWANEVVFPWFRSDSALQEVFTSCLASGDLYEQGFLECFNLRTALQPAAKDIQKTKTGVA